MYEPLDLIAYETREERAQAMERDGFIYLPAVINAAQVAELRACSDRITTSSAPGWEGGCNPDDNRMKEIHNAFNRDPLYLDYLDKPDVIDLVEDTLGDECHIIQMTQWNTGKRGEQTMHTDLKPINLPDDVAGNERVKIQALITTAHFYLDDIYEELGPTRLIPGSHRAGHTPKPEDDDWKGEKAKSILCKAGDVVVFRSDLWHRGGANSTDQIRYLLQVLYSNRWIAQRFVPFLSFRFDEDILAKATPRHRRILGEHHRGAFA